MSLCLALGLLAGGLPAEASEVVKLARLVVSGKRGPTETPRTAPAESTRSSTSSGSNQTHASSGGNDDSGTAPAPTRGAMF